MPNRRLPEPGRARQQRDLRTDRRLRFLERRTRYPSVTRVAEVVQASTTTGVVAVYVSVNVKKGAWLILASVNVRFEAGTNGTEAATLTVLAYSAETGELIDNAVISQSWRRSGGTGNASDPIVGFRRFVADEPARLDLRVWPTTGGAALDVELYNLQLIAVPL